MGECKQLSTYNVIQLNTTHNHNSYTKTPKKIYHHKTKNTTIMNAIFSKLQTLNQRSDRSKPSMTCYGPTVQIWA